VDLSLQKHFEEYPFIETNHSVQGILLGTSQFTLVNPLGIGWC